VSTERPSAPLTFNALAPVFRGSRVAASALSAWRRFDTAVAQSRLAAATSEAHAWMRAVTRATLVGYSAWVVATAAATHLFMLTVVERYHFPRPTALALPAAVMIVALGAGLLSADIARAVDDRRER
jgi:hypothetical protein